MTGYDFTLFLLVVMRMSGCIMFSPIFGRRNLPGLFKAGFTLLFSIAVFPMVPPLTQPITSFWVMVVVSFKELLVGFVLGFILNLFLAALLMGGEVIDLQTGISMAKIYDPASNVSMPISASIINVMYMLVFFLANGHLTLIRLFALSNTILPYGPAVINTGGYMAVVQMFSLALTYGMQLALPVVAVGLVTEVGVGLLMKAVPQIDVFTINLQLKLFVGFLMLLLMVQPLSSFLERLVTISFDQMERVMHIFAGG